MLPKVRAQQPPLHLYIYTCTPRCNGKVFEAEKMTTKRGLYHKKCFACIKVRVHTTTYQDLF